MPQIYEAIEALDGKCVEVYRGHWEPEAERPSAAVIDELLARLGVEPSKLALLGMSIGGYFAYRAAEHEPRLVAVTATPAFLHPFELFACVEKQEADEAAASDAAHYNYQVLMWKSGTADLSELIRRWDGVAADPRDVQVPFLSVLGKQEGGVWKKQTEEWHASIPSPKKSLVILDAETGADAHCQGNSPLRLAQAVDGWLREVL